MVEALFAEEEMLKPVRQPLNTVLRDARAAKGLTQKQLGKQVGVSNTTICQWETLKKFPNNKDASKVAQVLETDG